MAHDADEVIRRLGLAPHPEGGHYRETLRDDPTLGETRGASTAIYYLLKAGEVSRWHRIDAAEVWHYYAGAPLELTIAGQGTSRRVVHLGTALEAGEVPQAVVPPGAWQTSRSLGAFTLVGCTVAPAFDFAHFELAPPGFDPAS